jgi:hypothetical protein
MDWCATKSTMEERMKKPLISTWAAGLAAVVTLAASGPCLADGRDWNDGPVINVSAIRTVDGHFDDYMHWLSTTWKKEQEAAKEAGLITSYRVVVAEAQSPSDPDIYLVVEYKNWAALDHLGSKFDAVAAKVEGSMEKAAQNQADRAKIRTILGSKTMQAAELK